MKRLVLIMCVAVFALAQTPIKHGELRIAAVQQERTGPVIHLTGQVSIETDSLTLRADEADINTDTNEILAHGDVRLKLK